MTDTPTPLVTPDEATLTTFGDARKIGHGLVSLTLNGTRWPAVGQVTDDERPVFWWPDPPRKVTIEIPADVRDWWAAKDPPAYTSNTNAIVVACRASREAEA